MAKTPWKLSHSVLGLVTMPSKVRAEWDMDYDRCTVHGVSKHTALQSLSSAQPAVRVLTISHLSGVCCGTLRTRHWLWCWELCTDRVTKATALRSNTGGNLLAFQGQGPSQLSEDRDQSKSSS